VYRAGVMLGTIDVEPVEVEEKSPKTRLLSRSGI